MTQVCPNQNLFNLKPDDFQNNQQTTEHIYLNNVKQNIEKVMEECKEISQNFKEFNPNESMDKGASETESNDKKSLLTEMLRESQLLQTETQQARSPKKHGKRPMSEFNTIPQSHRKLLKQIDFSDYRLEGMHPKREKKVGFSNCGQCTECTIF